MANLLRRSVRLLLQKKVLTCLSLMVLILLFVTLLPQDRHKYALVAGRSQAGQTFDEEPAIKVAPPQPPPLQLQQQQQLLPQLPPMPSNKENIPESLRGLINSTEELKGRHSDYLKPPCQDPHGLYQWKTDKIYDFVGPYDYLLNYKNPCWLDGKRHLRCVPYFYLIGTPKAGSTDIFRRILQHPDILGGRGKEIRWFDRRRYTDKRYKAFDSYVNFFSTSTQEVDDSVLIGTDFHHKVIGDGGPTYYFSSYYWRQIPGNEGCSEPRVTAMSHIHHLWPNAKLILLARNPTSRLYSAYNFNSKDTGAVRTPQQFHDWVVQSLGVWNTCIHNHSLRHCMYEGDMEWKTRLWSLHTGLYSRYILDVLKVFPREQLLIVPTEEYSVNTLDWMRKIFKFLDVEELSDKELKAIARLSRANKTKGKKKTEPMFNETKKLLDDFYRPYHRELAGILGDDNFIWLRS